MQVVLLLFLEFQVVDEVSYCPNFEGLPIVLGNLDKQLAAYMDLGQ